MIYIWITTIIAAVDVCIKNVIDKKEDKDFPKEMEGTGGSIMIYKNHNAGFPFGVGKQYPELVKMIPLAVTSALIGIYAWLLPKKGQHIAKVGLALTLGGAFSNLYDRIVRGYVVDYFCIRFKALKKVALNLGDVFIFLGTSILLLNEFFQSFKDKIR